MVNFANKSQKESPGTVKLTIQIYNWDFKTIKNSLAVILEASGSQNAPSTSSCENSVFAQNDSQDNLRWFQVSELYLFFL